MIELPETYVLSEQINKTLSGKKIKNAAANAHPHSFAWYTGDPAEYGAKLAGKKIISSPPPGTGYTCGGVEIILDGYALVISTPIKYHAPGEKLPKSHQLLIEFEDGSHMSCTVQMWGAMSLFKIPDKKSERVCDRCGVCTKDQCPDPLTDGFDKKYFDRFVGKRTPENEREGIPRDRTADTGPRERRASGYLV